MGVRGIEGWLSWRFNIAITFVEGCNLEFV